MTNDIERLSEEVEYLKLNLNMLKATVASLSANEEPEPVPIQQRQRRAKLMEDALRKYGHGKAYRDCKVEFAEDGIHVMVKTRKDTFVRSYIAVERTLHKWMSQDNT